MKKILALFLVLLVCFCLFSEPVKEKQYSKYVASTSWVASIAQLAGIDDITIIAPENLKHPPEYEITPDDILKVVNCDLFMHAGYEVMVKAIKEASEVDQEKVIKVKTTNTLSNLENMVNMISQKADTVEKGSRNFSEYKELIEQTRLIIKEKNLDKIDIYANVNQAEFARDLGLNVVDTFGSDNLDAKQIELCAKEKFTIVIDNIHNPVSDPIKAVSPSSVILMWRNFPETMEDNALYNIVKGNIDLLLSAFN